METTCPHCRARFAIKPEAVGKPARCKRCGDKFTIANTDGAVVEGPPDYLSGFNAVKSELIARLGPTDGKVLFSPIPLYVDPENGMAESLTFREHVKGVAYCTCPLSMYPQQQRGPLGYYELMMCSRAPAAFMPQFIGSLARYTFSAVLAPGHTMDIGSAQPPGSTIRGLLCATPAIEPATFSCFGRTCTILVLVGITQAEMESCLEFGSDGVLLKLKSRGEFPFTTMNRKSIV